MDMGAYEYGDCPPALEPSFLRGDCNGDGSSTGEVTDAVYLLNYNFTGGLQPPCLAACDANGDGAVTVSDVVFLSNYVIHGGAEPRPSASGDPNEDCAIDMADVIYLWDYVFLGGSAPLRGWEID